MPAEQQIKVRRAVHWVGIGIVTANLLVSAYQSWLSPRAGRASVAPVVLGLLAGLLVAAVGALLRGRDARGPLVCVVAFPCAVLIVHPLLIGSAAPPYPPLFHVLGSAVCLSALVSPRVSLIVLPVFAAVIGCQRSAELGPLHATGEALLLALSGAIASVCVHLLERAGRTVHGAVSATHQLQEGLASRDAARLREGALEWAGA